MDELNRGKEISMKGRLADRVLSRALKQIEEWGLVMPRVDPLVFDFGIGDFERTGEIEFWIANENSAGYCGKFLFVFAGQTCPKHMHREKHETFYIVKGRVLMDCGGTMQEMNPGDVLRVDTGSSHSFTGIESSLLLEVSKPSLIDDNYFENTRIPFGGNYRG